MKGHTHEKECNKRASTIDERKGAVIDGGDRHVSLQAGMESSRHVKDGICGLCRVEG